LVRWDVDVAAVAGGLAGLSMDQASSSYPSLSLSRASKQSKARDDGNQISVVSPISTSSLHFFYLDPFYSLNLSVSLFL